MFLSLFLSCQKYGFGPQPTLPLVTMSLFLRKLSKKNRGFSEFGTKGGRVCDLNHYFEQQWNSEKGEGVEEKDTCKKLKIIMENNSITLNVYIWCFIWVQFSLCALKSDKFYDII